MLFIGIAYGGPLWIEAMHKDMQRYKGGGGGSKRCCGIRLMDIQHRNSLARTVYMPAPNLTRGALQATNPELASFCCCFIASDTIFLSEISFSFLKFPGLKHGFLK